jgi:uncharacterized protein
MVADMSKRLRKIVTTTIVLAALASVSWLAWRDTTLPVVHPVRVAVPGLRREYRILEIADLHGATFGTGQTRIGELVRGRRYDAIVLAGDMMFSKGDSLAPVVGLVRALAHASDTIVFAAGNHDDDRVGPALSALGVHDLDTDGPVRVGGLLIGSGEPGSRSASGIALRVVVQHVPPAPGTLAAMTGNGAPPTLVLSGHTHGGQIRLPLVGGVLCSPTPQTGMRFLAFPELRGVRVEGEFRDGRTESYISPGLGAQTALGLPSWMAFRVGDRAEITELVVGP